MDSIEISSLHERNPHRGRYNFPELIKFLPELKNFVVSNPKGDFTIDFSDSDAVLFLNKALLKKFYHIDIWAIPQGYLCPPIPGRADYIHYSADLLAAVNDKKVPVGKRVNVLDIGTGANCIYPIIGSQSYGWKFTATEIDSISIKTARLIVQSNSSISKHVKIKQQKQKQFIFHRMIEDNDHFDLTICNPPFHGSKKEALESNLKKWGKINKNKHGSTVNKNFGGSENELWCPGGEMFFIKKMIRESADFSDKVLWFTSLVSKKENLTSLEKYIKEMGSTQFKIVEMSQGNKKSRFIAWSYLSGEEQLKWGKKYWK